MVSCAFSNALLTTNIYNQYIVNNGFHRNGSHFGNRVFWQRRQAKRSRAGDEKTRNCMGGVLVGERVKRARAPPFMNWNIFAWKPYSTSHIKYQYTLVCIDSEQALASEHGLYWCERSEHRLLSMVTRRWLPHTHFFTGHVRV